MSDKGDPNWETLPTLQTVVSDNVIKESDRGIADGVRKSSRSHKVSDDSKEYRLKTLTTFMKTTRNRLIKQTRLIDTLMQGSDSDIMNNEMSNVEKTYVEITDAYSRGCGMFQDDDVVDTSEINMLMEEVDGIYLGCKENVCSFLLNLENDDKKSMQSKSSKRSRRSSKTLSERSANSKGSSVSSSLKSIAQEAKVAGLKAEAESIRKRKEAELNVELLRIEQKIKKEEAIGKVYASYAAVEDPNSINKKDKKKRDLPKTPNKSTPDSDNDLESAMLDMIRLQSAPKPDLDVFSGDPLEYLYFKANFKEVVESTVTDQRGRLTRLIKYTSGEAKELVKYLVHADSADCYDKAIKLLDKEYGNLHLLSCSYLKELRQWKTVKENDTDGFKRLYRFLLKCKAYKDNNNQLMELDSVDMIRTIISKIPLTHQGRWTRKAVQLRKIREADFSDLVDFFEKEAEILSDPAYSKSALAEISRITSNSTQYKLSKVSFSECRVCKGTHDIEDCEKFLQLDISERHKTVFREGLCFGCLEDVEGGHVAKDCDKRRSCRICKESHPTTLHGGKTQYINHTGVENNVISMCVVPVHLWHKDHPDKKISVYALLDDCSQGTFVTEEVLEILDLSARRMPLSVNTLNGETVSMSMLLEKNSLCVQYLPDHTKVYSSSPVLLPVTFSRPSLAVDKEEIPTPSKIALWPHLQTLMDKIPEYDSAIPIGLMIGGNCPQATAPLEVIEGNCGGPFAKRTRLGWCVVGPLSPHSTGHKVKCCHTRTIPVTDVSTNTIIVIIILPS